MLESICRIRKPYCFKNNAYWRYCSTSPQPVISDNYINVLSNTYMKDDFTNVSKKVLSIVGKNLHNQKGHPLFLIKQRLVNYFYRTFVTSRGNPQFSIFDNIPPVVSIKQNFDSLLIPLDHVSRQKSDCYYVNQEYLLRAHTTAHQSELIQSGLNNFLVIGDVYRRDEIDSTHYPVFHQVDAVRLQTQEQLFSNNPELQLFEKGNNTRGTDKESKQACHSLEAVKLMEYELKATLTGLANEFFGRNVKCRWVDTYFPFTEPSWELEVFFEDKWLEVLGCGIMKQQILNKAGVEDRIGWAFGIGLERLAMCLYKIPDIRLFWSRDTGFLSQFATDDVNEMITYKPISQFPQCINDISFWLPENDGFSNNDFYDIVRSVGGDLVEQVVLLDVFKHPKSGKISNCYRIIYRHMEKTLTQQEVNLMHKEIEKEATKNLGVVIR